MRLRTSLPCYVVCVQCWYVLLLMVVGRWFRGSWSIRIFSGKFAREPIIFRRYLVSAAWFAAIHWLPSDVLRTLAQYTMFHVLVSYATLHLIMYPAFNAENWLLTGRVSAGGHGFRLDLTSVQNWWRAWNPLFQKPIRREIFDPVRKRFGATRAAASVFVFSAVLHEVAILTFHYVEGLSGYIPGEASLLWGTTFLGIFVERSYGFEDPFFSALFAIFVLESNPNPTCSLSSAWLRDRFGAEPNRRKNFVCAALAGVVILLDFTKRRTRLPSHAK
ncbi:hypothetical protein CTAYLR_009090 [Chrysophaeum taylorii]|uniref:Wax synthase domain-containing protein n=1 Tax=Chrysophaeum taylorii TaxID=2483200 RepID=A0AAD7UK78_9STRA|nr:hypothetical protein CTAYLR_009090 [Chrysophaeum taylorii]